MILETANILETRLHFDEELNTPLLDAIIFIYSFELCTLLWLYHWPLVGDFHSNIAIVALVFAGLIIDLSNKRNPLLLLQCNYLPSRNHMVMNYFKSSNETSNLNGYYMYLIEHLFKNVFISHFSCTLYLKSFMIIYIV